VQFASLLAGGVIILFGIGMPTPRLPLRRIYIAVLFAMLVSDLYAGVMRWRVHGIGVHTFFEWVDTDHRVNSDFFADLHASPGMNAVVEQILLGSIRAKTYDPTCPGRCHAGHFEEFVHACMVNVNPQFRGWRRFHRSGG